MAIRIEILSSDATTSLAAYYHEIDPQDYSPLAKDNSRTPAGNALSAAELASLRNGQITETVISISVAGLDVESIRVAHQNQWETLKQPAYDNYLNTYTYVGSTYNSDGTWS